MTSRQAQLLHYIANYKRQHGGVVPTMQQMADALGLKSKGNVHAILARLEQRGYISRQAHRAQSITILKLPAPLDAKGDLVAALETVCRLWAGIDPDTLHFDERWPIEAAPDAYHAARVQIRDALRKARSLPS